MPEQALMLSSETVREIREAFERCQRRYPTVSLPFERFCARVEEVMTTGHQEHAVTSASGEQSGTSALCSDCLSRGRQLHHEDLFLALACALDDRIAWEHFADEYLSLLKRFATQACRDCDAGADLAQEVVAGLLGESHGAADGSLRESEPEPGGVPAAKGKLMSYNGRGSLAGWLRVAVAHAAIDRFRRERKQVSLDQLMEQGGLPRTQNPGPMNAAEERLDARWGPVLAQALIEDISRLGARDRLLLSLYHFRGVPLKAIGLQFGVHEATASRWLERVRRGVRKRVERALRKAHGLSARELKSLWRWASESESRTIESALRPAAADFSRRKKVQGGIL